MKKYVLYHSPHTGSEIIQSALILCNAPVRYEILDYEKVAKGKVASLKKINPLSRLPTLITPKGEVLTESGAILIHLGHAFPKARLIPNPKSKEHDQSFRILFIITGEIYPCFTFMDDPSEWVKSVAARGPYRDAVLKHQKQLWLTVESLIHAKGPWAMGKNFSAIDLYLASMTTWRPGMEWFQKNAPRIFKIAQQTRAIQKLKAVY